MTTDQLPPFSEWITDHAQGLVDDEMTAELAALDIAQSFRATNEVKFKQAGRLANGETQFTYDENIQASAGAGNVSIPESFTLGVIPFIGGDQAYEITARLRYTLRGGELKIGYQLVRPEDVERDAFNAVLADVTGLMEGTSFLRGPAPAKAS